MDSGKPGPPCQASDEGTVATRQHHSPLYAAWTYDLDDGIGILLKKLQELGLEKNTLVVFTSDNGGTQQSSQEPLRGNKGCYYEGGFRSRPVSVIRKGDWKLHLFHEEWQLDGGREKLATNHAAELYHVADDVGERKDLANSNPAKRDELLDDLVAWFKAPGARSRRSRIRSTMMTPSQRRGKKGRKDAR